MKTDSHKNSPYAYASYNGDIWNSEGKSSCSLLPQYYTKAGAQPHTQVTFPWHNVPPVPLHKGPIRPHRNVQLIKGKIHFLHI